MTLRRLVHACRLARFATMPDRAAAAAYLARHPDLAGDHGRTLMARAIDSAARRGKLPLLHLLYERAGMLNREGGPAPAADPPAAVPLDAEEIERRLHAAMEDVSLADSASMERAIEAMEALAAEPGFLAADARARLPVLADAGALRVEHYRLTRSRDDLDRARAHLAHAAALAADDPAAEATVLGTLAGLHRLHFEQTSDPAFLRLAVETWRRCIALQAGDETDQALDRLNLATALVELFTSDNDPRFIEESIALLRGIAPPALPHRGRVAHLRTVGGALVARYRLNGHATDLDDAVQALEAAYALPDLAPDELGSVLAGLGGALVIRGVLNENDGEVQRGVRLLEEGFGPDAEIPAGRAALAAMAAGIARMREEVTGESLGRSVERLSEAAAALEPGSGVWDAQVLSDLGETVAFRWLLTGEGRPEELTSAIRVLKQAGRQRRSPQITVRMALSLAARAELTGSWRDRRGARRLFRAACSSHLPEVVLIGGWGWGDWALRRGAWREALDAYGRALQMADRLFTIQASRAHKEMALRVARVLPSSAAYAAVRVGRAGRAVEVLEQGRARLVADALSLRDPELACLEREHPDAAARFHGSANALAELDVGEGAAALPSATAPRRTRTAFGDRTDRLAELRGEMDRALAEIRALPGYAAFQAPLSAAQIAGAARAAPIVYIAVTPAGAMALLVEPGHEPAPVWLDGLGAAEARMEGYLATYRAWRESQEDGAEAWAHALDDALRWAWDAVMAPVLEALRSRALGRAVLVPQGLLQLLPLHAAWTTDPASPDGRRYAGDHALLTSAPSTRLLLDSARAPGDGGKGRFLLVDDPDGTLGFTDGEAVRREAERAGWSVEALAGGEATLERVRAAAPHADVLHFSAHADAVTDRPLESGVSLAGAERLTLEHILELRLDRRPLVFLSACETAVPGTELPDEVVSLSTAFLQAGASAVVGSLWPVDDAATHELAAAFYAAWAQGAAPADALRRAQRVVRELDPRPFSWSGFTCAGTGW